MQHISSVENTNLFTLGNDVTKTAGSRNCLQRRQYFWELDGHLLNRMLLV